METLVRASFVLAFAAGCSPSGTAPCNGDFEAQAGDFECLRDWPVFDNVRIVNRCGRQAEAESLLREPRAGATFPVGTIIQLIPTEAMVKRAPGFDADNHDWEYFDLGGSPSGTTIKQRGRREVENRFGSCLDCHAGAKDYDFICGESHGCGKLALNARQLAVTQQLDARCLPP